MSATIDLFHPVRLPEMELAALEVLRSGHIASGANVAALEQALTVISGRNHMVSTSDLTSAIHLALHLAGVQAGDEVATVAFSCLQSNSPIAHLGARPIWVDIDPTTMSMSLDDLAAKLTPSVKAVMVYHIAGYPSDTGRIAALCRDRGIQIIEDCNNAIGATLAGIPVGVLADYAVYSLYPNRQINGIDGGVLAVPNETVAEKAIQLRRFGVNTQSFRDSRGEINPNSDIPEIGWSFSLNNLNAAVALSQLDSLHERTMRSKEVAKRLIEGLRDLNSVKIVKPIANADPSFWGFLILSQHRDALIEHLNTYNIKSSILHQRNDWYSGFGKPRADLPGTEFAMSHLLAIPCGFWLTENQIDEIISHIIDFDEQSAKYKN